MDLRVNGNTHSVTVDPETPLLYVLRNHVHLNGPKFGCGLGQCGACMVLLDGNAIPSCQLPVARALDRNITTLEGLAASDGTLHPVQQAFIKEQAAQCGYCLNGTVMATVALLQEQAHPSEEAIRDRLQLNICRCGVHSRVIRAIQSLTEK